MIVSRNYDLIVFDWDGTVMDSTGLIARSLQRASADLGLRDLAENEAKYIIGLGIHDSTRHLFPDLSPQGCLEFAARYRYHYVAREHETPPYAGIPELLADLRSDAGFLAVATGKPRAALDRAFAHTGLGALFHFSRCADEGFPKPHPDMLLKLMDFTGVDAQRVLMIGDTTHDLQLAANAGVAAVAVSYGAHPPHLLDRHAPLACLPTVSGLRTWLTDHA